MTRSSISAIFQTPDRVKAKNKGINHPRKVDKSTMQGANFGQIETAHSQIVALSRESSVAKHEHSSLGSVSTCVISQGVYIQLFLRRTPSGPAPLVHREVSGL